eukprot:UN09309
MKYCNCSESYFGKSTFFHLWAIFSKESLIGPHTNQK